MKKLLLPALLIPSVAMAGMVIVDDGAPVAQQTASTALTEPRLNDQVSLKGLAAAGQAAGDANSGAVVALPVPAPAAGIVPVWSASAGSTLRESIQKWADQAKWTLVWDAPDGADKTVNYRIVAQLSFQGPIDEAVGECIRLYERAKKPLGVEINRQQKLLYVHLKYR
jgi:type IV pili sensor histidine kinase/response regulator